MATGLRYRRALAVGALLAMVALAGCSAPGPPSVCYACDRGMDHALDQQSGVSVQSATVDIHLQRGGDARWKITARLSGPNVSDLTQADAERIGRTAVYGPDRAGRRAAFGAGDVQNVSTTLREGRLRITYTTPGIGERRVGGLLVVDGFHSKGGQPSVYPIGADRMVLHAPEGMTLLNDPQRGEVQADGRTVVWSDRAYVSANGYFVYGGSETTGKTALGQVLIGIDVLGWVLPRLVPALPVAFGWGGLSVMLQSSKGAESRLTSRQSRGLRAWWRSGLVAGIVLAGIGLGIAGARTISGLLFIGWPVGPPAALVLFAWHAGTVAIDSEWRTPLVLAIGGYPLVFVAPYAASPLQSPSFLDPVMGGLVFISIPAAVLGSITWLVAYWLIDPLYPTR